MRPGQEAPDELMCVSKSARVHIASMRPGQEAPDEDAEEVEEACLH